MVTVLSVLAALIFGYFSYRYAWWRPAVDYHRPRILMYHMVSAHRSGGKFNKLRVPPRNFERQLEWLRADGWHFVTISELAAAEELPAKTVALTFDDGYEDNLLNADPILERYGAKATLYLVEDRFDRDWSTYKKAHHDSGELRRESKLSDEQVRAMLHSGRWELGGHTRTHANLPALAAEDRAEEISESRRALSREFVVPLESFAYPFGLYSELDVDLVEQAGFTTAVTTVEGIPEDFHAQRFELPRVKVSGKDNLFAFGLRMRTGKRGL